MKKKHILLVVILCLLYVSCSKNTDCKYREAPKEKEISWTDYNTVNAINDYLRCYQATRERLLGDTLAVMGYSIDTHLYYPAGTVLGQNFSMKIGDKPCSGWLQIYNIPGEKYSILREGAVKYYIIGTLTEEDVYDGGCCGIRWPAINTIYFDTTPGLELIY